MARRAGYSMVSGSGMVERGRGVSRPSARQAAAPLRSGPSGDTPPSARRSASMAISKLPAIWPSPNTRRTCDRRREHVAPCPCASRGRRMALRRDRLDPDRGSWSGAWRCGAGRRGRRCLRSAFFWWRGWPAGGRRVKRPRSVRCVPATVRPETARRASARRGRAHSHGRVRERSGPVRRRPVRSGSIRSRRSGWSGNGVERRGVGRNGFDRPPTPAH